MTPVREYENIPTAVVRAAPPLAATGMTIWGYPIADWLVVITILYTLVQLVITVRGAVLRRRRAVAACKACEHLDV